MRVLVVEGGGMKACYANGVLKAFHDHASAPFDVILGSSAGAVMGAWYGSGQIDGAIGTWPAAADPNVLNVRRALLRKGPLLDGDQLFDHYYPQVFGFQEARLREAPQPILACMVDIHTGVPHYVDLRELGLPGMKATSRLPLIDGGPVKLAAGEFLDGGIADPVPVQYAVETLGASHVTLIANQPPTENHSKDNKLFVELAARQYPALRELLYAHDHLKSDAMAYAMDPPEGVTVEIISPPVHTGLTRLSKDLERIRRVFEWGRRDGIASLHTHLHVEGYPIPEDAGILTLAPGADPLD